MKEEKRRIQKIPTIRIHRGNNFRDDHTKLIAHIDNKQNLNSKSTPHQSTTKIIKRIGCRPIINAYRVAISQPKNQSNIALIQPPAIPKPLKQLKQIHKPQTPNKKNEQSKKLKRIGKKTLMNAYKQIITTQQIIQQQTNNQQLNHLSPLIKITLNKQSIQQFNQIPNKQMQQIYNLNITSNYSKLSTNKKKDQDQTKIIELSQYEKSNPQPINSNSSAALFSESLQDDSNNSKIKLLLQETQRKYQISKPITQYQQQKPANRRNSSNFLQVPNLKRNSHIKSNDSSSINSLGFTQDISNIYKTASDADKTNSDMNKSANSFLSSQSKIFEITEQTNQKTNNTQLKQQIKQNNSSKDEQIKKNPSVQITQLSNPIHLKKIVYTNIPPITESVKFESVLQQIYQDKEDQNKSQATNKNIKQPELYLSLKKSTPKPSAHKTRFSIQENPRKIFKSSKIIQHTQKIPKSSCIKQHFSLHSPAKIQVSQISLHNKKNSILVSKQNLPNIRNSNLSHQTNKTTNKIKRQSIALKFSNQKQKMSQNNSYVTKTTNTGGKLSKKFEVNKCLADARKTLNFNTDF